MRPLPAAATAGATLQTTGAAPRTLARDVLQPSVQSSTRRERRSATAGVGNGADAPLADRTIEIKLMLAESSGRLDLSELGLDSVPPEVFDLTGLEEVSLAGNQLFELPDGISRLTSLRRLQLAGNSLRTLPESLGSLSSLEGLWLHGNRLKALPASLGGLASLEQLQLAGNRLAALPPTLGALRALKDLSAAGNQLQALPAELSGCSALAKLSLFGNRLVEVPGGAVEGLLALQELWVQGNAQLAALPAELAELPRLAHVSAADCALRALPSALGRAPALRTLSAYGNCLEEVSAELLEAPLLQYLWLEGNPLSAASMAALLRALRTLRGAHAQQPSAFRGLGLDDGQLAAARAADVAAAGRALRRGELAPGSGRGYFKLEPAARAPVRGAGSSGEQAEAAGRAEAAAASVGAPERRRAGVLVVAFGSAPGVPNWGGLLRRVRNAAASDQEADFDVLYVVDPSRSWYDGGDAEGMAHWESRLEGVAQRYSRVLYLGDSMGATAALLLAPAATSVHVFCPQVDLSISSIRPGEGGAWFGALRDRALCSVRSAAAGGTEITVHVGNWQHDLDQAGLLPPEVVRTRVYSVDSHRLAAALDARGELLSLVRSALLGELGLPGGAVRLVNLV